MLSTFVPDGSGANGVENVDAGAQKLQSGGAGCTPNADPLIATAAWLSAYTEIVMVADVAPGGSVNVLSIVAAVQQA